MLLECCDRDAEAFKRLYEAEYAAFGVDALG